jgi:hypothetical protein
MLVHLAHQEDLYAAAAVRGGGVEQRACGVGVGVGGQEGWGWRMERKAAGGCGGIVLW